MSGNFSYSIYIHVPFCTKKCGYCHFFVLPDKEELRKQYLRSLQQEFELKAPLLKKEGLISVYFGGGTPSLLNADELSQILGFLPFSLPSDIEITLEANPEALSKSKMQEFAAIGINRVSLGIQSLDDSLLQGLTRTHSAKKAIDAVLATYESGIENISIDLMYDLPGQTLHSWQRTLEKAIALPITHLSLYNLTIEPHTPFFKKKEQLFKLLPDEKSSLEMLERAVHILEKGGLTRYEISAFSKQSYESRHNTGYWSARPFLGFGPSAFSYWDHTRSRNVSNLNKYSEALELQKLPVDFCETLPTHARKKELLAIGVRLLKGVIFSEFDLPFEAIKKLCDQDLLRLENGRLQLTSRGMLFYDSVAVELIE